MTASTFESQERTSGAAALGAFCSFLGAIVLAGFAGPLPYSARYAAAFGALAVVAGSRVIPSGKGERVPISIEVVAPLLVAVPFFYWIPYPGAILVYAIATSILLKDVLPVLGLGLLVGSLSKVFLGEITAFGQVGTTLASPLGAAALALAGQELPQGTSLGPSTVGLQAVCLAVLCLALSFARHRRRVTVIAALLVVIIAFLQLVIGDYAHSVASMFASHGHDAPLFWHLPLLALLVSGAVAVGMAPTACTSSIRWRPLLIGAFPVAVILGALCSVFFLGWRWAKPQREVAFFNVGGFSWGRPNLENRDSGMFGLLPEYLRADGWNVYTLDLAHLAEGLRDTQVLVLMNCPRVWDADERRLLQRFVEDGGALLVLGDHTDIFGLMTGFNSLLSDWGIEFRFDSGCKQTHSWESLCEWNPWAAEYWVPPADVGTGIGASLLVRRPALPVLTGRYGFSDKGIRENTIGALLGDYKRAPDEDLGDICLAATANLGRGSVWVFGDTSGLQNTALEWTYHGHVRALFERLARPAANIPLMLLGLVLGALIAASLVLAIAPAPIGVAYGISLGSALGLLAGLLATGVDPPATPRSEASVPRLVIDRAHFPATGHYEAKWNWVFPLSMAAFRSNFLVEQREEADYSDLGENDVLAFIAPRKALSGAERAQVLEFMRSGGCVLVFTSAQDSSGIAELLHDVGVQVEPAQLGPIPKNDNPRKDEPTFVDASPLRLADTDDVDVLYAFGDEVLAAATSIGEGSIVVVGDTRICSEGNVEGIWGMWPPSARFLADIMIQYGGGAPQPLKVTFEGPEGGID